MKTASDAERVRLVRERFAPRAVAEPLAWIQDLQQLFDAHGVGVGGIRGLCSELAWLGRSTGQPFPSTARAEAAIAGERPPYGLAEVYVQGFRLRFDFRFADLGRATEEWLKEYPDDVLPSPSPRSPRSAPRRRTARSSTGPPWVGRTATRRPHACLVAVSFAHPLPDQANSCSRCAAS